MKHVLFCIMVVLSGATSMMPQEESYICRYLFASSNDATQLSTEAISLGVDAVWEASGITGTITTTGTLTQNPANPEVWTYSPVPNDKLVVNFSNGLSVIFIFYTINGYTGGTAEDFKWSHQMDFNTFIENYVNIRVNSNTYPQGGKIYWQRTITGTAVFDSQLMNLNISHTGNIEYEIGSGFAFYTYTEQASGTSSTGSFSVNINEGYWRFIGNDSNTSLFVMNTEITNNSSGNFGGTTYKYQNARVYWVAASLIYGGYYNLVRDAHQWAAEGTMQKNGQNFGTVQFDGPVINDTHGPNLVLHTAKSTDIFLHTLIDFPVSIDDNKYLTKDYIILQNYPNPFNSSTLIQYEVPLSKAVSIRIYDILGREVDVLINNEEKLPGIYQFNWNARLPSGTYFCRMQVLSADGTRIYRTIKLVLLK